MKRVSIRSTIFLLLIVLNSISCQAVSPTVETNATSIPTASTLTPTVLVSPTPTTTPLYTSTPATSPTLKITPSPLHLSVFEELWDIVDREYLYPDFNGIDWDAIKIEYRKIIEIGLTDEAFHTSMDEMISKLADDHSVFLNPEEARLEDAQYHGENDYVGIGILTTPIPERNKAVILLTFTNSPAENAGIKPRDSILAVDGGPVLDENGSLLDNIRGPIGSNVTLTIKNPAGETREVTLERQQISGFIPVPYEMIKTPGGKRIGYILLVTFADKSIAEQISGILTIFHNRGYDDGLIIDNRLNEGGVDYVLNRTLAFFTQGTLGYFVNRYERYPLAVRNATNLYGSQEIPLVILIGPETVSYGEIFAGVMKDNNRAYLIGEPTNGNIETLWGYNFEDGSRAWIAHDTFQPIHHPRHNWERTGVRPDLTIPVQWDQVSLEEDPAVIAALEYFDNQ